MNRTQYKEIKNDLKTQISNLKSEIKDIKSNIDKIIHSPAMCDFKNGEKYKDILKNVTFTSEIINDAKEKMQALCVKKNQELVKLEDTLKNHRKVKIDK